MVSSLLFVLGLVLLVLGAEWLVRGASNLALRLGLSPLVVGLTIVAFGTSAPELAVSVGAALDGSAAVAVGNVVGSNIFNILVILGLSAVITPLVVSYQVIRQEVPVLLAITLLAMGVGYDGVVDRGEGAILLGVLVAYTAFLVIQSRRDDPGAVKLELAQIDSAQLELAPAAPRVQPSASIFLQLGLIVVGLAALVLGSAWLVDGATAFARALGVSDTIIGVSVVAAGTSLPEVATSITAALRGQRDIAVGNVIGSNAFNLLGCIGVTALVAPGGITVPAEVLRWDGWVMLAATVVCVPIFLTGKRVARGEGAFLLAGYAAYSALLVSRALGAN